LTSATSNYTRLAAAIVIAAVVIGAGIAASSYLESPTTVTRISTIVTTTTSTASVTDTVPLESCNNPVWSANNSSANEDVPVLLMQPESTALICVTYQSAWAGNASEYRSQDLVNGTYQFGIQISKEHCEVSEAGTSCTSTVSHAFKISAIPSTVQPSPATNYITIIYTISSLSNSTGFYDGSAPFDDCNSMPMAVGYAASQVNASDFAPRITPQCIFLPFTPSYVSVGGINVTYIDF
jgi:hypothetical protein